MAVSERCAEEVYLLQAPSLTMGSYLACESDERWNSLDGIRLGLRRSLYLRAGTVPDTECSSLRDLFGGVSSCLSNPAGIRITATPFRVIFYRIGFYARR